MDKDRIGQRLDKTKVGIRVLIVFVGLAFLAGLVMGRVPSVSAAPMSSPDQVFRQTDLVFLDLDGDDEIDGWLHITEILTVREGEDGMFSVHARGSIQGPFFSQAESIEK